MLRTPPPVSPARCGVRRSNASRSLTRDTSVSVRPDTAPGFFSGGTIAVAKPSFAASFSREVGAGHRADLAGEPDLAEHDRFRRQRPGQRGRGECRRYCEVCCRLGNAQAAGDVEEDVAGGERHTAARLQDRQDHRQPGTVPADNRAPGRGKGGRSDQRLNLHQNRPAAFDPGKHRRPGNVTLALGKEQRRRVWHLLQTRVAHLEHADFVRRPEAVLHRAKDAELMAAFTFEIQHRIDHVFQHLGTRDHPFLGDMSNQQQDEAVPLGEPDQHLRRSPHLRHRPRRRVELVDEQSLHRVRRRRYRRRGVRPVSRRCHPPMLPPPAAAARPAAPAARRAAGAGRSPLRRRCKPPPVSAPGPMLPAEAALTCRCRDRRRSATPSRGRGRRRSPGQTRRSR